MEFTINSKAIIGKDLLVFSILGVHGETEEAALPLGIKLSVLRAQLKDLALSRIGGGEPADHLNLPAEEIATLILIGGVPRSGISFLDDKDRILTFRQGGDRDREAELHPRKGRFQGDDCLIGEGVGYAKEGGQGECVGRTDAHGERLTDT